MAPQTLLRNALSSSRSFSFRQIPYQHPLRQCRALPMRSTWHVQSRHYATEGVNQVDAPDYLSEGERKIFDIIKDGLEPIELDVQDISGGCGSMYALKVVSEKFKGLPIVKQHRMVNQVLGEEMKKWHGVQLKTKAP